MGNTCSFTSDAADENPWTDNTSSYAGTSSMFTGFSEDKSSVEQGFSKTAPSENISKFQPLNTNLPSLKAFSFNDLKAAAKSFRSDSIIGEGGFGIVYKGYLDEQTLLPAKPGHGMSVAIKKLKLEGTQGHREWLAEVHYLGSLYHPNLVKLVGFCNEDRNRLLVYEFMARGSLENHIFRKGKHAPAMSWVTRMKIALDAAKGVAFLHGLEPQVIYRDFKSSNILLDSNYNAKLSDFGLAKYGPVGDDTHVSTRAMGTHGYAAPEYLATGHLTVRSDVYSFGVVLLELLTGLKTMDHNRPPREVKLVDWIKPMLKDRRQVMQVIDPKLAGQFSKKAGYKTAQLALTCLDDLPKSRPTMAQVVECLLQISNISEQAA